MRKLGRVWLTSGKYTGFQIQVSLTPEPTCLLLQSWISHSWAGVAGTGVGAGTGSQGGAEFDWASPSREGGGGGGSIATLLSAPAFWASPEALLRSVPGRAASVSLLLLISAPDFSGAPISASSLLLCPAWSWPLCPPGGFLDFFFPLLGGSGEASLWGPGVTSFYG